MAKMELGFFSHFGSFVVEYFTVRDVGRQLFGIRLWVLVFDLDELVNSGCSEGVVLTRF